MKLYDLYKNKLLIETGINEERIQELINGKKPINIEKYAESKNVLKSTGGISWKIVPHEDYRLEESQCDIGYSERYAREWNKAVSRLKGVKV